VTCVPPSPPSIVSSHVALIRDDFTPRVSFTPVDGSPRSRRVMECKVNSWRLLYREQGHGDVARQLRHIRSPQSARACAPPLYTHATTMLPVSPRLTTPPLCFYTGDAPSDGGLRSHHSAGPAVSTPGHPAGHGGTPAHRPGAVVHAGGALVRAPQAALSGPAAIRTPSLRPPSPAVRPLATRRSTTTLHVAPTAPE